MATTLDREQVLGALRHSVGQETRQRGAVDMTGLYLGYMYLLYQEGRLGSADFLKDAGLRADQSNYQNPSCEQIYAILNRVEALNTSQSQNRSLATEGLARAADELFVNLASAATKQSEYIMGLVSSRD